MGQLEVGHGGLSLKPCQSGGRSRKIRSLRLACEASLGCAARPCLNGTKPSTEALLSQKVRGVLGSGIAVHKCPPISLRTLLGSVECLCGEAAAPHRPEAAGAPYLLSATAQLRCHPAFGYPKGPRAGERDGTVPLRVCSPGLRASNQVRHVGAVSSASVTWRWDWQGGSSCLTCAPIGVATWDPQQMARRDS